MFEIIEKIDNALESKNKFVLWSKMGSTYRGVVEDSWARVSSGKMRGKIVFKTEEDKTMEIDVNDILDLQLADK